MKRSLYTLLFLLAISTASFAQGWQFTGELSTSKRWVQFSVLPNNTVLATGGLSTGHQPNAECEIYDPCIGTWRLTAPLKEARILHSVVTLTDGRIAVFGGQIDGTFDGGDPIQTSGIEIFDPVSETWSSGGNLVQPRQHQTATRLSDGRVLIVGGLTQTTPQFSAEIWDPVTLTSTAVASMHQNRYEHHAVGLTDGRVMITGGRIGGWNGNYLSESEIYDPELNTWTVIEPMFQSRMRGLLIQFSDGSVLSAAGRNAPQSAAPGSELFDLSTGRWTSTDAMKEPCTWLACSLFQHDRYLATGGIVDATWTSSTDVLTTNTCEWYDKENKRWYFAPSLNQSRGEHGIAYLHHRPSDANWATNIPRDMILVGGGITGNNTYTSTCEVLDVSIDALTAYMTSPKNSDGATLAAPRELADRISVVYDNDLVPHLSMSISRESDVNVVLTNCTGRIVKNYSQYISTPGHFDLKLATTTLSTGMYFVQVGMRGKVLTEKIVVNK